MERGSLTAGQALVPMVPPTSSAPMPVPWPQVQWPVPWQPSQAAQSVSGGSERPVVSVSHPAPVLEDQGKQAAGPPMDVGVPAAPVLSLLSPDEAITGPPHQKHQMDDTKAHQELLKRVAFNLGLQAEELEEPSDSLFDILCASAPARVALLIHEGVSKITNALWQTPSSLAPISKRAECKYFMPTKGHEYLYSHPAPNSLVVQVINHKERQGQLRATPKNKDSRWLDLFGRKIYLSSSLQLRVANHQALLGQYDFNMWQAMAKFEGSLPEASKKEFRAILNEGTNAARAALQVASDVADAAACTMASAISMQQASWLLLSGLSTEAQQSMQDLCFDGWATAASGLQTSQGLQALPELPASILCPVGLNLYQTRGQTVPQRVCQMVTD
ncbi:hypothetical protein UY3_05352 [Chelonia mydas]|uniref:Lamina-associated polypeptide 2 alpha C-terminal domain-containing protein n=1 Tax=Chelonia mydas TaxID=8469 RepID=M7BZD3_CHEMY|nr:hypothetical protein UY3_05352 [Chelonia mydas]